MAVTLVKVLRLVDSEKKLAMGYIYEAMDKAVHTKRWNRLEKKRLHDLVFVKYNQALHQGITLRMKLIQLVSMGLMTTMSG
uniref:Uncharacterized protein n=1 Tax=Cajanus cajan TaxID=3821 RepID=A0A151TWZ4_CAJCA|nr:hypothetical protein KK1_010801 [Cajanus cajan]